MLDAAESAGAGGDLSARGAAIRGIANFASETVFAMRAIARRANWSRTGTPIDAFFARHGDEAVLLFGFTFIVWTDLLLEAERRGSGSTLPHAVLLHSGGWKKLTAQAVTKEEFSRRVAEMLGGRPRQVLDFYGMVEQVGTVLVDCPAGHKHAPAFADVLIRRPYTLTPAGPGETGIIEVLSALPTSYPGQALLTEDEGLLVGVDDCPCGRKGSYFRFARRIEQAEVRGCGDTFRPSEGHPMNVLRITRKAWSPPATAWRRSSSGLNRRAGMAGSSAVAALLALLDDFSGRLLRDPRTRPLEGVYVSLRLAAAGEFAEAAATEHRTASPATSTDSCPWTITCWRRSPRGWSPCGWPATWRRCRCSRWCRACWRRTSAW